MTLMRAGYCADCNVQMEQTNVTAEGAEGSILKLKGTVVCSTDSVSGIDFRSPHPLIRNVE